MMQLTEQQKKEGWCIVKFGDVAKEVKASTKDPLSEGIDRYVGLEHIDSQSLRLSRWGMIEEDNPSFTKKFSAGDILFGRRRAYLKKAAVPDFDGICSGDIIVMAPKGKDLLPDMLPFIVQSDQFFDWAIKHSAGGLSPRTKFKSLADFEFPLPPRKRQEEMLEIFRKLELTLACYDGAISKGGISLEKMIKASFFDRGKTFKAVALSSLIEEQREHFRPDVNSPELPYVGFEHIDSDSIQIKQHGSSSDVHSNKLFFESGDILYGKIRPYLKKTALANFKGVCSSDIIVLRPLKPDLSNLVSLLIKSDHFANLAMNTVSGSKMPRAHWKTLAKTELNQSALENKNLNLTIESTVEVIRGIKRNKNKTLSLKKRITETFLGGAA